MSIIRNMEYINSFTKHKNLWCIEMKLPTSFLEHNDIEEEEFCYFKQIDIVKNNSIYTFLDKNLMLMRRIDLDNGKSICNFIFK